MLQYIVYLLNEMEDANQYEGAELIRVIEANDSISDNLKYNSWLDQFEIPISIFKENGATVSKRIPRTELEIKDLQIYYYVDGNRNFCFGIRKI